MQQQDVMDGYDVPRPIHSVHYDMAGDITMRVEQENAYEHMQTLHHRHADVQAPRSDCMPTCFQRRLRAAILVAILLNFVLAIAVLAVFIIQREQHTTTSSELDELRRGFASLTTSSNTSEVLSIPGLTEIFQELNRTKNAWDDRLRLLNRNSTEAIPYSDNITRSIAEFEKNFQSTFEIFNETINKQGTILKHLQANVVDLMRSALRLVGGSSSSGRVEIFYDGEWGTICDDGWDENDGSVICRMLGFSQASAARTVFADNKGQNKIWLSNVNCTGEEYSIWQCEKDKWGFHNCSHEEDAAVDCI